MKPEPKDNTCYTLGAKLRCYTTIYDWMYVLDVWITNELKEGRYININSILPENKFKKDNERLVKTINKMIESDFLRNKDYKLEFDGQLFKKI